MARSNGCSRTNSIRKHRAVLVRDFGNRLPLSDEREIIERWAKATGVMLLD
ncbi:hypothetical protein NKH19_27605 [Mesorhizobium sp. M1338]|uniref:hypothetical protein n=1 Tax=Mesorhizobium sp. M1338 TaxID=2957085 RepID=UPI00333B1A82